jgi:methionyl aminopeptidase
MSITNQSEFIGIKRISEIVAHTLKAMKEYAKPGMNTKELDKYGAEILKSYGAKSAPNKAYKFPGWTCISVGKEFCHGIPSNKRILREGDLINIDVSAELNGFWADNGSSFVLGRDIHNHSNLVNTSRKILKEAIQTIKNDFPISEMGGVIETLAKQSGYKVIKNLMGHGVGRHLHEEPAYIANFKDTKNKQRFKANSVVAIETFISTDSNYAIPTKDGWTMVGDRGGFMAQHEHTIIVTDDKPIVLTWNNGIFEELV